MGSFKYTSDDIVGNYMNYSYNHLHVYVRDLCDNNGIDYAITHINQKIITISKVINDILYYTNYKESLNRELDELIICVILCEHYHI